MSLTTDYRTEIVVPQPQMAAVNGRNILGSPCLRVLRGAMEVAAKERVGGQIAESYTDCRGVAHPVLLALVCRDFPRGVGVDVEAGTGRVVFRYDQKDADTRAARAVCEAVQRHYNVIAVVEAAQSLGFTPNIQSGATDGRVRIDATR